MRLAGKEINAIRAEVAAIDPEGVVYLFGSRTDDSGKGGDIDLFLEASANLDFEQTLRLEARIASLCDTKVDLLVKSPNDAELPIHRIAKKGVRL
ncbi:nucleotidyltransferase family protein [Methylomonas fluvii]|uniref:Nucleotidyltransferase domain-containing protein n=1 Tax=Methylomonas fluvii TaxID=1854564 RepID=A0ABR9DKR9_9GAMM|nr:nucleotidyltransferase domain-containing protein [Methylomonas fluvii]MBD9362467.1 nucleotidyltransferase domain-containing protein [Methylomonas fluvii]CAD6875570.1 hypothetical protein [Methylomonas fluvii]